jgi:hypothetical protein
MQTWEFLSPLLDYLEVNDILNLSIVNKRFHNMLTKEDGLINLINVKSKNTIDKQRFLNERKVDNPLVRYLLYIFYFKIHFTTGIEKFVNIKEVGKTVGEIGNEQQIKKYITTVPQEVSFGLAKAGRFSLLHKLGLSILHHPENRHIILAGLASGNHCKQIEEWLSFNRIEFNSPIDPMIEACKCGNLEAANILFPYYRDIGINVNNLVVISQQYDQLFVFNFLLPFAYIPSLLPQLQLDKPKFVEELNKSTNRVELAYYLLGNNQLNFNIDDIVLDILRFVIRDDNSVVLNQMVKLGFNIEHIDCSWLFIAGRKESMKTILVGYLASRQHSGLLQYLDNIFYHSNILFCKDIVSCYLNNVGIDVLMHQYPNSKILKIINKNYNSNYV